MHSLEVVAGTLPHILQVDREAIAKPGAHYILLQLKSMVVLNFVYKTRIIL